MLRAVPKPTYGRLVPKRGKRGEFSKLTRKLIFKRDDGSCQQCGTTQNLEIHHIMPKSSGKGRGVVTNGSLFCHTCHQRLHENPELMYAWQVTFEERYGPNYFRDQYDYE